MDWMFSAFHSFVLIKSHSLKQCGSKTSSTAEAVPCRGCHRHPALARPLAREGFRFVVPHAPEPSPEEKVAAAG